MSNILNELTKAEIEELKSRLVKEAQPCVWCDKKVPMRYDQKFCSSKCRAAYSAASAQIAYERLLSEREVWLLERESLGKEVARLREVISDLK